VSEVDERELTSDLIPDSLVFSHDGIETARDVHAAKAENKICEKCGQFAEVWTFILKPINQHPNCLVVHRGSGSCGWRSKTVNISKPDGWTIKEHKH
tara:strand:- start:91 stop:381 length:291 start_codon:yes stop_codon:yes gene_type:complete